MRFQKKTLATVFLGISMGVIALLGLRFVSYKPETVHYHANYAVYIQGEQQQFDGLIYSLDGSCSMSGMITPQARAHLAKGFSGVVHVQDNAVTWGQFFENLGWYVGPDFIETADGTMYQTGGQGTLHIIINGQDYTGLGGVTDQVIHDQDRLLLSYGNEDQSTIVRQYKAVPSTARKYDGMKNVSTCGHTTKITFKDRMEHLL